MQGWEVTLSLKIPIPCFPLLNVCCDTRGKLLAMLWVMPFSLGCSSSLLLLAGPLTSSNEMAVSWAALRGGSSKARDLPLCSFLLLAGCRDPPCLLMNGAGRKEAIGLRRSPQPLQKGCTVMDFALQADVGGGLPFSSLLLTPLLVPVRLWISQV